MKYKKIIYIFFISLFIVGCQSEVSKANSVEEYILFQSYYINDFGCDGNYLVMFV
ncbi:hypothetical protein BT246_03740 [Bacillus thuringiensis]|uniref:Lipoprotein n=1 Tax=Bacillus thuringiensis TaxID=1428 RepID=A0A9W3WYB6_BACTU|nr:hypothetical protein BT246_03740 [Bacillus thuringiensis]